MQEKSYVTVNSKETLKQLIDHINSSELVAYDTETNSLNPRKGSIIGFSVSGEIGKGYYMPIREWRDERLQELFIDGTNADKLANMLDNVLDEKVDKFNQPNFIENDPISIPHLFAKKQDIEIAGLFAAVFAWGQRNTIINKCTDLSPFLYIIIF